MLKFLARRVGCARRSGKKPTRSVGLQYVVLTYRRFGKVLYALWSAPALLRWYLYLQSTVLSWLFSPARL